jgi:hypothetical protein
VTHEFCDHCPGCRPALLDLASGRPYPDTDPLMLKVNHIWNTDTTYAERKAFIDVTVHNSREPEDLRLTSALIWKIERAGA